MSLNHFLDEGYEGLQAVGDVSSPLSAGVDGHVPVNEWNGANSNSQFDHALRYTNVNPCRGRARRSEELTPII